MKPAGQASTNTTGARSSRPRRSARPVPPPPPLLQATRPARRLHRLAPNPPPTAFPDVQFTEKRTPPSPRSASPTRTSLVPSPPSSPASPLPATSSSRSGSTPAKVKSNNVVHGTKTHRDFDYSGTMIDQMLPSLIAHRTGKKLGYDLKTGRSPTSPKPTIGSRGLTGRVGR
uniref:Serine/arginine repetitive matrix 1 n=1 Tax=Solibacter usitatus (strain Ellin6076) TaxID=234267 RepID=Q01YL6_SOLUE